MVQVQTVLMAVVMFFMGLLLGLIFHLPGASSPLGNPKLERHARHLTPRTDHSRLASPSGPIQDTSQFLQMKGMLSDGLEEITLEDVVENHHKTQDSNHIKQIGDLSGVIKSEKLLRVSQTPNNSATHGQDGRPIGVKNDHPKSRQTITDSQHLAKKNDIKPVIKTVKVNVAGPSTTQEKSQLLTSGQKEVDLGSFNNGKQEITIDDSSHEKNSFPIEDSIVSGIYWSAKAESLVPVGFTPIEMQQWKAKVQSKKIIGVSEGCGRMQNRQLLFGDATKACARYRLNTDQIQGEIYSYYLSRVLGMTHVLPSILATTDPRSEQWRRVNQALRAAQWGPDHIVIVTPWVEGLKPAFIPAEFRSKDRNLHPGANNLRNKSSSEIQELVQWSDLLIFDYLTANLDRVVNNMYNEQWNPDMMKSPAHNLEREPDSGLLVFLDNESGLFHSYRLLDKYSHYHKSLLEALCIFRQSTADKIKDIHSKGDIGKQIMELFSTEEPLHRRVPKLPERTVSVLQQRLNDVHRQISHCDKLYSR